jgi:hypothetical protein
MYKDHRWPGCLAGGQRAGAGTKQQGGKGKKPEMSALQSHTPDPLSMEKRNSVEFCLGCLTRVCQWPRNIKISFAPP